MTLEKIRVIVYTNGSFVDVSDFVKTVAISGDTTQFHRTCTVSLIATTDGRKPAFTVEEGTVVKFQYGKKTYFHGFIFAQDITTDGDMTIVAHDANAYLSKNTDSRIYKNKKASEIIKFLARDFDIPIGTIADTGYVIPFLRLSNMTLYDMILKALTFTQKQTGKRFFMGCDDKGNLTLKQGVDGTAYVFKDGVNLISATYSRSIEDTKTQAKVIGGKKGKEIAATVKSKTMIPKYGVLQAYEVMDESATPSQIKQRAQTLLQQQGVVEEQLNIEVLGVPEVDVGTPVYFSSEMTKRAGAYYVTAITHNHAEVYTMSLELSRTHELPDVTISEEEIRQ